MSRVLHLIYVIEIEKCALKALENFPIFFGFIVK